MTGSVPDAAAADPAADYELMRSRGNGQDWLVAWHPPGVEPAGTPHGAAGVCVEENARVVLISHDGHHWGFPAGRPEGGESAEETLHREMLEEACSSVLSARLLGYARSECVHGEQKGVVLVRSFWRADVTVRPWRPKFEIGHRRIVPITDARSHVSDPDAAAMRISLRALSESGIGG